MSPAGNRKNYDDPAGNSGECRLIREQEEDINNDAKATSFSKFSIERKSEIKQISEVTAPVLPIFYDKFQILALEHKLRAEKIVSEKVSSS